MDWIKLKTKSLIQRIPDDELLAIVKYELLWGMLEEQPDERTALAYMTRKQLNKALLYSQQIINDMSSQLQQIKNKREKNNSFYRKNKDLEENSDIQQITDGKLSDNSTNIYIIEKRREENKKENNIKEKVASNDAPIRENLKPKKSIFEKPTLNELCDEYYVRTGEKHSDAECVKFAEKFLAHYESVGWKVGKNPMKDWRACVRTWIHNEENFG